MISRNLKLTRDIIAVLLNIINVVLIWIIALGQERPTDKKLSMVFLLVLSCELLRRITTQELEERIKNLEK